MNGFRACRTFFTCLALILVLGSQTYGVQSYHVGNSLTADTMGNTAFGVLGIQALAAQGGSQLDVGFHIDASRPLHTIWADPNGVDATFGTFGTFDVALPANNWDYVTLQPHISLGSTQGLDRTNINNFINLTKSNPLYDSTNFFVLQTWPRASQWPYSDFWVSESIDDPNTPTLMKRQYFDNLMPQVKADNPGTSVWMIPTGEVLYELDQQFLAGTLPDVTSHSDFFRTSAAGVPNGIHMSLTLGRYVAATTAYATMFKKDVRGQEIPTGFFQGVPTLTPALLDAINETIWDVLTRNPWSGLADFNNDSTIDGLDLTTWEAANGIDAGGDADFDGDSDGTDFLIWQKQFAGAAPFVSPTQVPEPTTLVMAFVAALLWANSRFLGLSRVERSCSGSNPLAVGL